MPGDAASRQFSAVAMRNARILSGKTQQEVADKFAGSRQLIAQLEMGAIVPTEDSVDRLAEALAVPSQFLKSPPVVQYGESDVFFRAPSQSTDRAIARARVGVEMAVELGLELSKWMRFPRVELPRFDLPSGDSGSDVGVAIGEAARLTRLALGLAPDEPIRDLTSTLECAGIFVVDTTADTDDVDAFSVRSPLRMIVRATENGSPSRQRLTLGHELAHMVLHQEAIPDGEAHRRLEQQANDFAGQFLLPRAQLAREFPRRDGQFWHGVFRIKAKWGISIQAIIVQAEHEGLITPIENTRMWQTIARRGWRRREPEEPAPETPRLLRLAFQKLHEAKAIPPHRVLDRLSWTTEMLERVVGRSIATSILDIGCGPILRLPLNKDPPSSGPSFRSRPDAH